MQCSLLVRGTNFIEYSFSLHVVKLKLAVFNDGTEKFKCCAKHGAHLIPSAGPDNQNQLFKGKCCGNKPIWLTKLISAKKVFSKKSSLSFIDATLSSWKISEKFIKPISLYKAALRWAQNLCKLVHLPQHRPFLKFHLCYFCLLMMKPFIESNFKSEEDIYLSFL